MAKKKKEVLPNLATKAKGKVYNREWVAALEDRALLQVLEIIARASLMRKESLGNKLGGFTGFTKEVWQWAFLNICVSPLKNIEGDVTKPEN